MPALIKPSLLAVAAGLVTLPAVPIHAAPDWPTAEAIERAREKHPFPGLERLQRVPLPALPRIAPDTPALDIAAIARRHIDIKGTGEPTPAAQPLRIFVSLSMPQSSLRLLTAQAERAQATLVLRGLKADSMKQTIEAVQSLIGERKVNWQIDPEAYARYSVRQTPTFVLVKNNPARPANTASCGASCMTANAYYSVAGDVSLGYALDTLVRRYPEAQQEAAPFLKRLQVAP